MSSQIHKVYWAAIGNRVDVWNKQGIEGNQRIFFANSMLYVAGLIFKIAVSTALRPMSKKHSHLKLSWSNIFRNRLDELETDATTVEYDYRKMNRSQSRLFAGVRLFQVLKLGAEIRKHESLSGSTQDNFFYRLIVCAEFLMFTDLVKRIEPDVVYIAGINDRQSIMLSEICKNHEIRLSILQHGCFTRFENQHKITAHEFMYFYDFSLNYLHLFIENASKVKHTFLPRKQKKLELPAIDHDINIAYATTPIKCEVNFEIIDQILEGLDDNVQLIINPHPRDPAQAYEEKYGDLGNVVVTPTKYRNVQYFFLRYSTLGVEMSQLGIESVFINLENYKTDFFEFGNFEVFTNIQDFRHWLVTESEIKEHYSPTISVLSD